MIVDSMVNRQLILGLAEKDGIKPSPELLTERFNDFINKMTPSQKKMIEAQLKEQGTSLEKRREDAAKDINSQRGAAIEQWVDKIIIPEIKIDDESAEKYYRENQSKFKKPETVKVAHILIVPDKPVIGKIADMTEDDKKVFAENADMKAKSQAEAVLAELKQGADFAKLAKEKSICPSKENGGILPDFDRSGAILGEKMGGKMDKTFTDVSYNLKPGDISDVVKTGFGYHIIKSLDHKKESYIPFETVKKFLKDDLKKQQISKKIKTLVDAEREKKKVVNHLKKKTDIPEK